MGDNDDNVKAPGASAETGEHPYIGRQRLRALPTSSGVYLMKDSEGTVLYVGKAKNLRTRVGSYFNGSDGRYNIPFLLERITTLETLVTEDERQALLLEADLIKKYRPRYNIRLKDDKAHLLVRIDMTHEWPRLELVRHVREDNARYIGPFPFSYELRTVLEVLQGSIPLRTCSDRVIYNRVRPCLEYQIKRCAGPCCLPVNHARYLGWVDQAVRILEGHTEEVVEELKDEMHRYSEQLQFEDAAAVRDRIEILEKVRYDHQQLRFNDDSIDCFAVHREGHNLELSVLSVRRGRLYGSKTFGFPESEVPTEELLGSALIQYYQNDIELPETVILPVELEDVDVREQLLSERRGKKISIITPKRGSKARLLDLAQRNAKENFEARYSDLDKSDRVLKALQIELKLDDRPRVIECVDISHFQGGATVGAVVSFKDMRPNKQRYRCFHLTQEGKPDDFASMREVVLRHLSRAAEENTLPDLMIIDGGPAQLAQAVIARKELHLQIPQMVGLAKKRTLRLPYQYSRGQNRTRAKPERVYLEGNSVPVVLNARSEALYLLERIRDEAHRFAITFHRKTRSRRTFRSELDAVPGIGSKRRNDLLRAFRSVEAIRSATPEELSSRGGVPLSLAQRILERLNKPRPEELPEAPPEE